MEMMAEVGVRLQLGMRLQLGVLRYTVIIIYSNNIYQQVEASSHEDLAGVRVLFCRVCFFNDVVGICK